MSARTSTDLHLVFVTEGGPSVGLGHVSRCLALAKAADGARVSFVVNDDNRVADLSSVRAGEVVRVDWPGDPGRALRAVRRLAPDAVVVDSYAASRDFLASLRSMAPLALVDDVADRGPLPVDVVINGGPGAERLPYERTGDTRFLLGPRYALLDPVYAEAPHRAPRARVSRVLICLGGGRPGGATAAALAAVERIFSGCVVDVAAGPFASAPPEREAAPAGRNRIVFHRARFGLRELMLEADVAVSGAGVTLCELAATATPTVAVCVADNQRLNLEAFAEAGAALVAGDTDDAKMTDGIAAALDRLAGDASLRTSIGAQARALVDGQGAARVAREITSPVGSRR